MGPAHGDPRTRFVADLNDGAFRSATGKLEVGNGLLESSNVTVTGQVGEILQTASVRLHRFLLRLDVLAPKACPARHERSLCGEGELVELEIANLRCQIADAET